MKIIVGNWKMNPSTKKEAENIFLGVKKEIQKHSHLLNKVKVVICPPFVYLPFLSRLKGKSKISLGAQNVFFEEKGAFTGEISAPMLFDLGVEYVIIGHSERDRYFGETDLMANKKTKSVLKFKMKPIVCIGETKKESKNQIFKILKKQITLTLRDLSPSEISQVIVSYEPVWAIGTGNPCAPERAKVILLFLRKFLRKNKILYGGSVQLTNARNYFEVGFDGLLIGGVSLKPQEFTQIIKENAV